MYLGGCELLLLLLPAEEAAQQICAYHVPKRVALQPQLYFSSAQIDS